MEKYFNDAIIGNRNILASYTRKGELLRLFYPNTDNRQFIDFYYTGIKVNDSGLIYLHQDINNTYEQHYIEDTNILVTEIINKYFEIQVIQTDFVDIKENIIIKRYKFVNRNSIDLDVNFLVHSKLISSENNDVSGFFKSNALIQYAHDYSICTFSKNDISSFQINGTKENIHTGIIYGKDYIGMSPDSSISYEIGTLKPGEEKTLELIIYINDNKQRKNLIEIEDEIERLKRIDIEKCYQATRKYWRKFVQRIF